VAATDSVRLFVQFRSGLENPYLKRDTSRNRTWAWREATTVEVEVEGWDEVIWVKLETKGRWMVGKHCGLLYYTPSMLNPIWRLEGPVRNS
jgi:hypothetical protein